MSSLPVVNIGSIGTWGQLIPMNAYGVGTKKKYLGKKIAVICGGHFAVYKFGGFHSSMEGIPMILFGYFVKQK